MTKNFFVYLAVMAVVTYLIRMLPLVLVKKKIKNIYLLSFLHYVPYAVLSVMTVPACFYATGHIASAVVGFLTALFFGYRKCSLLMVAATASAAVFLAEIAIKYLPIL